MKRYTIAPSRIAAVLYVTDDVGFTWDCVFMDFGKPAEIHRRGECINRPGDLPVSVRAAVHRVFGTFFALPIESRGSAVASFQAFTVECDE